MSHFGNLVLNYALREQAAPPPPVPWLALFVEGPGGLPVEVSGGGYERVNVSGVFAAPSLDDSTFNAMTISFPTPLASWGKAIGAAIFDALTGGNLLIPISLESAIEIPPGPPVYFNPGTLILGVESIAGLGL